MSRQRGLMASEPVSRWQTRLGFWWTGHSSLWQCMISRQWTWSDSKRSAKSLAWEAMMMERSRPRNRSTRETLTNRATQSRMAPEMKNQLNW